MAKLGYSPEDKEEGGGGGRRAEPGTYSFYINEAYEDTFRSGNDGVKIKLDVAAFEDKDVTVFENFVYVSQALWKLEEFLTCLGFDFNNPPEIDELIGKEGKAKFKLGAERDGKRYLEVEEYLKPGASPPRQSSGPGNMPPEPRGRANDNDSGPRDEPKEDEIPF